MACCRACAKMEANNINDGNQLDQCLDQLILDGVLAADEVHMMHHDCTTVMMRLGVHLLALLFSPLS